MKEIVRDAKDDLMGLPVEPTGIDIIRDAKDDLMRLPIEPTGKNIIRVLRMTFLLSVKQAYKYKYYQVC